MTILTIGKRLVSTEQIAYVEPFDPASNPDFKPEKDFKARIVLLNRDTVLTEMTPHQFVEEHNFLFLAEDDVSVSSCVFFWVESFEPSEKFQPQKPYRSRLKWRDLEGRERSMLLLTEARAVTIIVAENGRAFEAQTKHLSPPPRRSRRKGRAISAERLES